MTSDDPEIIAPFSAKPSWLIGARTFLMDWARPECEQILMAAKPVPGGKMRIRRGDLAELQVQRPRRARLRQRLLRPKPQQIDSDMVLDARHNSPQNWAHFLDDYIPLYFHLLARLGLGSPQITLILPEATPGYIRAGVAIFGMPALYCDADFQGPCLIPEYQPSPEDGAPEGPWLRMPAKLVVPARAIWAQDAALQRQLDPILAGMGAAQPLPRRVFLARRKTRAISNPGDLAPILQAHGFVTLYPEDLSAGDQIRLFHEAEVLLAIHGAGLAPLLLRRPDSALQSLIEILPCGHMNDNFRVIAEQVGVAWTGIRGRLKPGYVTPAQDMTRRFMQEFSLDNFDVDPASLARALELAGVSPLAPQTATARPHER